jgi:hypothetical protein
VLGLLLIRLRFFLLSSIAASASLWQCYGAGQEAFPRRGESHGSTLPGEMLGRASTLVLDPHQA